MLDLQSQGYFDSEYTPTGKYSVMTDLQAKTGKAVQGNLDPLLLVAGGDALDRRIDETLAALAGKPYIFNLGHGIVPQTPPEHVAQLVERVRAWRG